MVDRTPPPLDTVSLGDLIHELENRVYDARTGLPEPVFRMLTRLTPMINVDLLVRDDKGRVLLAWRDDEFGAGWHVPGGIIRWKEPIEARIAKVAELEMGMFVSFDEVPCIYPFISSHATRGHFISLLYECRPLGPSSRPDLFFQFGPPMAGQIAWHDKAPDNLLGVHEVYRPLLPRSPPASDRSR